MINKNKQYSIPKFNNIEEEDKFWQSHSPLMEGHKGKVQKKRQNRNSFLSIRFTNRELSFLRARAKSFSLLPSAYARKVLIESMKFNSPISLRDNFLFDLSEHIFFNNISDEQKEEYCNKLGKINNKIIENYEEYFKVQEEMLDKLNFSASTSPVAATRRR